MADEPRPEDDRHEVTKKLAKITAKQKKVRAAEEAKKRRKKKRSLWPSLRSCHRG